MARKTLEQSLAFLAPSLSSKNKKEIVSPVHVPEIDQDEENLDLEQLLGPVDDITDQSEEEDGEESEEAEEGSEEEDGEESEEAEEGSEEEDGEESEEEEEGSEEEDGEESEEEEEGSEEEDGEESEEREDEEIVIKTKNPNPLTPSRIKIKFPRSPKKIKIEGLNKIQELESKLKTLRYSIIRMILNEDDSFINYVLCFDPNGEMVFVDITGNQVKAFDVEKLIKTKYKDDKVNMSSSFIEGIRNRLNFEIYGVVFYDGCDYSFVKRNSEGVLYSENFTTLGDCEKTTEFQPQVYAVIDYKSLIKDPILTIKRTKLTYKIIQEEQVDTNKFTINSIMTTSKELSDSLKNFESTYKIITKDIVEDWKNLSNYSAKYYNKFTSDDLSEQEKEDFDKITVNMFARFQVFNYQIEKVDNLTSVIEKLNNCIYSVNSTIDELKRKNDNLKNKLIEIKDLELYI